MIFQIHGVSLLAKNKMKSGGFKDTQPGTFRPNLNAVCHHKMLLNKRNYYFPMPKTVHLVSTAQKPEKNSQGKKNKNSEPTIKEVTKSKGVFFVFDLFFGYGNWEITGFLFYFF